MSIVIGDNFQPNVFVVILLALKCLFMSLLPTNQYKAEKFLTNFRERLMIICVLIVL